MARYVGHRESVVEYVGDCIPQASPFDVVELPTHLHGTDPSTLMEKYQVRHGRVVEIAGQDPAGARVAFVGVYGVPCGISTYTEALVNAIRPQVAELRIFAAREPDAVDSPEVVRCWERGKNLNELVTALREWDPDVIYIQHEYGNFPSARHWLAFMSALDDMHVVTTLHSVYAHRDKLVVEAACRDIVVHTDGARRMLKETKQVGGRVSVIGHGCKPLESREKLWNLYGSEHTLVQFGFGFDYKGWDNAIRTVAELKKNYSDVFYTGLMSERWAGAHTADRRELINLARELEVLDHVALIRGYQSEPTLEAYMRTNKVAIFPYKDNGAHEVFGSSGAAREAMTFGIPVVASSVPLFEGLQGIVERPSTVEGWAEAVEKAFDDPEWQIDRQAHYLAANSWDAVAREYLALL